MDTHDLWEEHARLLEQLEEEGMNSLDAYREAAERMRPKYLKLMVAENREGRVSEDLR